MYYLHFHVVSNFSAVHYMCMYVVWMKFKWIVFDPKWIPPNGHTPDPNHGNPDHPHLLPLIKHPISLHSTYSHAVRSTVHFFELCLTPY